MDSVTLFQRAVDQTGRIVAAVDINNLPATSPCTEWDTRQLLNHTIATVEMFDRAAQALPFDPSEYERDCIGSDPGASYEAKASNLRDTLSKPESLTGNWTMPFGETPGPMAISIATMEVFQHGWDVARATGQQADFDPDVTEAAFATARMMPAEMVRVPGVFGPEQDCPDGAPAHDQLAAFLGRQV
jgi:uncharacterized protein (TIGR03086 family)